MRMVPPDRMLGAPMGARWLPRDSIVQTVVRRCVEGERGVSVLSVDPWYRQKGVVVAEAGQVGCLPVAFLQPDAPEDGTKAMEKQVLAAYRARFGPVDEAAIKATPWGRVALPMYRELSAAELEVEQTRERLVSQKQKVAVVNCNSF